MPQSEPLTEQEKRIIKRVLPKQIQRFVSEYPQAVYNVAEAWKLKPYSYGHIPEEIAIYYADDPTGIGADIIFDNGKLVVFRVEPPKDKDVIKVSIDDEWAYIQVGSHVLLDRLGDIILPDMMLEQSKLLDFSLSFLDESE